MEEKVDEFVVQMKTVTNVERKEMGGVELVLGHCLSICAKNFTEFDVCAHALTIYILV